MQSTWFFLLLLSVVLAVSADEQSVGVSGQLYCGDSPAKDVTVKLVSHKLLGSDDVLATGTTNTLGNFELVGEQSALLTILPQLKIYTDCEKGLNPCKREITFGIPESYVVRGGGKPKDYFSAGTIQLQFNYKGEGHKCF